MSLTLRTVKGSALSHAELDNNFLWLKGRDITQFDLVGSNLVLTSDDGNTLSVSLAGFTGGTLSGDTYVTSANLSGTTLNLVRNDSGIVSVDLSPLTGTVELTDYFSASVENQKVFNGVLSSTPLDITKSKFYVNGVKQRYGSSFDYIITGGTDVVWVSISYDIGTTDELNMLYV